MQIETGSRSVQLTLVDAMPSLHLATLRDDLSIELELRHAET
jgi:hypothetical protein